MRCVADCGDGTAILCEWCGPVIDRISSYYRCQRRLKTFVLATPSRTFSVPLYFLLLQTLLLSLDVIYMYSMLNEIFQAGLDHTLG